MSAVESRWGGGPVDIVKGGVVQTVTYRHAVSLVSRGLASWHEQEEPAPKGRKPREKVPSVPVEAPLTGVLPEREGLFGDVLPDLPESAYGPDAVPLEVAVSSPTPGVEADQQGYEPARTDP